LPLNSLHRSMTVYAPVEKLKFSVIIYPVKICIINYSCSANLQLQFELRVLAFSYNVSKNSIVCPRNKQKFISVRTETNRNSICFGSFSVCFAKPITMFFGLFRGFGPVSKQPKQTDLFRNKPKNRQKYIRNKTLRSLLH
jgi:hypothetical protein